MTTQERSISRVIAQVELRRELLARMHSGEGWKLANPASTETQRLTGLVTLLERVSAVTMILDDATSLRTFQSTLVAPVLEFAAGALIWLRHYFEMSEIEACLRLERGRQDDLYGVMVMGYRASDWAAAFTEEVGEVAREAFRADRQRGHSLATGLVQVLALAVWWMELLGLGEEVGTG